MKRKYHSWALFLFFSFLLLVTIYFLRDRNHFSNSQPDYTLEEHLLLDKEICDRFNGTKHQKDGFVVNSKNDTISFEELLSLRKPIVIVRFSSFSCPPCVEFMLQKTIELFKGNPNVTKLMLIADIPVSDLHVIQKDFEDFTLYKSPSLLTDFDMALTPYLYFIDENLEIRKYYIPRKEILDETNAYFFSVNKWLSAVDN